MNGEKRSSSSICKGPKAVSGMDTRAWKKRALGEEQEVTKAKNTPAFYGLLPLHNRDVGRIHSHVEKRPGP
jgi:hypothetical protein